MKTRIILMTLCFIALQAVAKTTYIPTYDNSLILVENGKQHQAANRQRVCSLAADDGLITCSIVQEIVSPELVKSIKRAKSAAGWSLVGELASAAAEGATVSRMNDKGANGNRVQRYVNQRELTDDMATESDLAKQKAEELKTLMVDLVVKNNSDKEMMITDMDMGLVWFILPHSELALPLAKGEECHYRISSAAPLDENVKYISATANSTLEKYTVEKETDQYWYVPVSDKAKKGLRFESDKKDGFIRIDKETMEMTHLPAIE